MEIGQVGIWSFPLRYGDPAESAEAAAELEDLGFGAVWIPDVGGPVFEAVELLLRATRQITVATGILNLWMHTPAEAAAQFTTLSAEYGDRLLMGVGVSHAPALEPGLYRHCRCRPWLTFLDGLDGATPPVPCRVQQVLAALGPKMLELAWTAQPGRATTLLLVTPEHTQHARQVLGENALIAPEQTVILCSGREEARAIGAPWLAQYLKMPNYANSAQRLGFDGG